MTFGDAIKMMRMGSHVTRPGWNGRGMYIYLKDFEGFEPCFVMHTANHKEQPGWLASQADMLAEDWLVVR